MAIVLLKPRLLLVEGQDDQRFFAALARSMAISNLQVVLLEGKSDYRTKVNGVVSISGFRNSVTSLGLVRDSDSNPSDTFQSMCDALEAAGLPRPSRPLIAVGSQPMVIVALLPSHSRPGELEDLCLESVAQDPATRCVQEYFGCLKAVGLPTPRKLSKAKVHAFLASREDNPGLRVGEAAEASYWPWSSPAFEDLKQFLTRLTS